MADNPIPLRPPPHEERARIETECKGWKAAYDSLTLTYYAKAPDFKTTGIAVHGRSAADVIKRVRSLEGRLRPQTPGGS